MTESERLSDATVTEPAPMAQGDPFGLGPGDMVDRYRIIQSIGVGGMGVVYRAHDPKLDREIALKLVRADLLADGGKSQARLLREAQAMAQVSHPNVLPIYDVGVLDAGVFIAMEYVEGQNLPQWSHDQGRSPGEIVDVFIRGGPGPSRGARRWVDPPRFQAQQCLARPSGPHHGLWPGSGDR